MSDPVLERSVLERKERDELQSIARAMGASPTSRTRKADLVDMILTTAGIITVNTSADGANATQSTSSGSSRGASNGRSFGTSEVVDAKQNEAEVTTESTQESPSPTGPEPERSESSQSIDASQSPEVIQPADTSESVGASQGADQASDETSSIASTDSVAVAGQSDGARSDTVGRGGNGQRGPGQQRGPGGAGDRPRQDRQRNDEGEGDVGNRRRRRRGRGDNRPERTDRPERSDNRQEEPWSGEPVVCEGLLDLRDDGYGFVRTKGYLPSNEDIYVSVKQTRQFGLRKGDYLVGASRPALRNEKNPALLRIDSVNGKDPEEVKSRPRFESLTPLFPDEKLCLETPSDPSNMTARIIDLISPIGKGQRGMIVSPPKAGKTTIMKQIVKSIEANNPDVHLMVLLVDERPEEVTDMRRSTKGEVIASTFDRPADEHTSVAELTIERAKRLVENGQDVVIVLDGITRLARAYNLAAPATGRIMSGGIDSGALYPPKKFFGSARNVEEGGSLTILATALIETGSKMDEVIFEEFKGTGNMELRLDRRLAERRIYPAIDVDASSTRHEELLFDRKQLQQVWRVRRALNALSSEGASPSAALERLMDGMKTFSSNDEFLAEAAKA